MTPKEMVWQVFQLASCRDNASYMRDAEAAFTQLELEHTALRLAVDASLLQLKVLRSANWQRTDAGIVSTLITELEALLPKISK